MGKDEDKEDVPLVRKDAEETEDLGSKYQHDPNFKGPISNRGCTDCPCLVVFIIFLVVYGVLAVVSYNLGDPINLIKPSDSEGRLCGGYQNPGKTKLMFLDILQCTPPAGLISPKCRKICVKSCPSKPWAYPMLIAQETVSGGPPQEMVDRRRKELLCENEVVFELGNKWMNMSVYDLVGVPDPLAMPGFKKPWCAAYVFPSKVLTQATCAPSFLVDGLSALGQLGDPQTFNVTVAGGDVLEKLKSGVFTELFSAFADVQAVAEKVIADVEVSWPLILAFLGLALIVALIWILLLRILTGPIVWLTLILFVGTFAFATYFCTSVYIKIDNNEFSENATLADIVRVRREAVVAGQFTFTDPSAIPHQLESVATDHLKKKNTWLALAIVFGVILGIALLVLIFLFKQIRIAIQLFKEAAKALSKMWIVLLWPLVPFVGVLAAIGLGLSIVLYLGSINVTQQLHENQNRTVDLQCGQIKSNDTSLLEFKKFCVGLQSGSVLVQYQAIFQFANVFMTLWLLYFVIGVGIVVLAGCFASYYWTMDKSKVSMFPILGSLWRMVRYHMGSVALGSFILAVIGLIRIILMYIQRKLQNNKENAVAKALICCLSCCMACVEKIVKFLTENAYILIAAHGKNFCISAKDGFMLIMRNPMSVAACINVTRFMLFISKLLVVGSVTTFSFFFFDKRIPFMQSDQEEWIPEMNYFFVPVIFIAIGSYVIATICFNVFEIGVKTLMFCFLEDQERNDGSAEKPYFMSTELLQIMNKSNEKPPVQPKD